MRVVSVNLNRRLGRPAIRERFQQWLFAHSADIIVAQEPFASHSINYPALEGFRLAAATPLVACWIAKGLATTAVRHHNDRWQELMLRELSVHNIYLSASSSRERCTALLQLAEVLQAAHVNNRVSLIIGDFNLAPSDTDGRFGDRPSTFTRSQEREALRVLLASCDLHEITAPPPGATSFTFERMQRGAMIRFRCDLALASRRILTDLAVQYDHSVRIGCGAFTDHSAILADIGKQCISSSSQVLRPMTHGSGNAGRDAFLACLDLQSLSDASYKTAIRRRKPSQIARNLWQQGALSTLAVRSILDYGCGYGADVAYYRTIGIDADGYDSAQVFGWSASIEKNYDLVTLVFVVNVLPSYEMRLSVVRAAARAVRNAGHLFIAARSASTLDSQAQRRLWVRFNDGWISDQRKGTFQKGLTSHEVTALIRDAGLTIQTLPLHLTADVVWGIGRR